MYVVKGTIRSVRLRQLIRTFVVLIYPKDSCSYCAIIFFDSGTTVQKKIENDFNLNVIWYTWYVPPWVTIETMFWHPDYLTVHERLEELSKRKTKMLKNIFRVDLFSEGYQEAK